jgi:DNA-directed RNA polymerase specialized sigma24 family protein
VFLNDRERRKAENLDESRRRGRSQTVSLALAEDPAAAEVRYGAEVARALDAALSTMPEGQRRIVLGRLIQGLSFAAIGRDLRLTEAGSQASRSLTT